MASHYLQMEQSKTAGIEHVALDDLEHNGSRNVATPGSAGPVSLERYINLSSIVNFGLILLVSWETFAVTFQFALLNGGPASMFYGCILGGLGGSAVAMSLAELASIDPTVGAQYRWSANLAPAAPKFCGLIQGWMTVFAWITGCVAGPALLSNIITGIAIFNYDTYMPERWHTTLIMWALILIPFISNIWFRKLLNVFELIGGITHIIFFIVSIVPLVVMARRSTPEFVFHNLTRGVSGWDNSGIAFGLGLLTITSSMNGFDGVLHMSDEVKKVRTRASRSIVISAVSNSIMLFAFVTCLLFTIGDVDKVTNTLTGVPLIEVYYEATKSRSFTNFLVTMPAIVIFFAVFNGFASVSRLVWQFSKDKGLPFSKQLTYVHPKLHLPLNALGLVGVVTFLLSIIYLVSTTAFNAIISLNAMALYVSYLPPISFFTIRRFCGNAPTPGPFTLGRLGIFVNLFALAYLIFVTIWMPFPQILPVTKTNMNYAGPVLGAVILGAVLDWIISGRKRFQVPTRHY